MSTGEVNQILQRLAAIEVKLDLAIDKTLLDHETRLRALERAPISFMSKGAWVILGGAASIVGNLILRIAS